MSARRQRSIARAAGVFAAVAFLGACVGGTEAPSGPGTPTKVAFAKGGGTSGITVTATNPSFGHRGETGKPVTVTGTGFAAGAVVTWERNGVVDPNIVVQSATVVSSTRIDAVITITETADLSLYDIGVMNADRKKGVGTEQFEVTTATSIGTLGGNTEVSGTNDQLSGAQAVGWSYLGGAQHAFYWPDANGKMASLGPGAANAISPDGATIAGLSGSYAVLWKWSGSSWVRSNLPVSAGVSGSRASGMAWSAGGAPIIIAGSEMVKASKGNGTYNFPRLWRYDGAAWQLDTLPLPPGQTNIVAKSVNAAGQAVGGVGVFWDIDGSLTQLPGPTPMIAQAINGNGTLVVGVGPGAGSATVAIYWQRTRDAFGTLGPWTGPITLPGSCARAIAIDNQNRILAHRCVTSSNRLVSAVFTAPYNAASMITLNGTGNRNDGGTAWGISPNGTLIGGRGLSGGSDVGIIWKSVLPEQP